MVTRHECIAKAQDSTVLLLAVLTVLLGNFVVSDLQSQLFFFV